MVPSYRKSSCSTTPNRDRYDCRVTVDRSRPSTRTRPWSGFRKEAARPASVVFPDPELPTNAVTLPAGASKLTSFKTGFPGS